MKSSPNFLGDRFNLAFQLASTLHNSQFRKGTSIPYIAHLMAVTALVVENGGNEDQAIAALLHDSVEDQGGLETLELIRAAFGERVARMVLDCSDSLVNPKPPWRQRKEIYLEHLETLNSETRLISLADKLHNARSILADLEQQGEAVWDRFSGGKSGTTWYYRQLADFFLNQETNSWMANELDQVVIKIEKNAVSSE